jgi:hypothetical protein
MLQAPNGAEMDIVFSRGDATRIIEPEKDETVRYGDPVVFRSCASHTPVFLAVVRQPDSKRRPAILRTEIAAPGKHEDADYIWSFVPTAGSKKRCGDPVSFADRVRIQLFDYVGQYRVLATSDAAEQFVRAERTPVGHDVSTWSVACAARLRLEPGGRALPDGEFQPAMAYGTNAYTSFLNAGHYLCGRHDPQGGTGIVTGVAPDLPATGMSVWWRVYRSLSDVPIVT